MPSGFVHDFEPSGSLYIMEAIASVLIIAIAVIAGWRYTGQPEYRNRTMVRVFWGAAVLYLIYRMFWT